MPLPPKPTIPARSRPTVVIVAVLAALVGLVLAWSLAPLDRILEPGAVVAYRDRIRALPFAPLIAIAMFVVGGFVSAPATLMMGATMVVFGPTLGPLYAMLGLLGSAAATCVAARYLFRGYVDEWLAARRGSWFEAFGRRLERSGILAIVVLRLTPTPYTLQNVVAGVSRVRLAEILVGTAIGVVPVITLIAGVTTRLDAWLAQPDRAGLLLLIGAVIAMVAIISILKWWAVRRGAGR